MKAKILSLLFPLFLLSICSVSFAQGKPQDSGQGKKLLNERIIVKFKGDDLDPDVEDDIFKSHKVKKHKFIKELKSYVVLAPSKDDTLDIIENLKKRKDVEYAEPDYYCEPVGQTSGPNDPQVGSQWQINNINLQGAWALNQGSSNLVVAVLDSGCDPTHEDLKDKYVPGYNFIDSNTNTADVYGHGTAVAGCIAPATNNGIGIAGTAYNCRLMPLRISDSTGYAYWSTLATALQYAANNGCKVANASFRCGESTTVQSAAKYMNSKGGVFVCSAGNQATLVTTTNFPEIIVVGATDASNNLAGFSNTGTVIDVVAPGVAVFTTNNGGGYGWWSGTSFSSPITAGVCALMLSANKSLTPGQVLSVLQSTALDLGDPGADQKFGYGLINAQKAVELAANTLPPPPPPPPAVDTTPPAVSITSPTNGSSLARGAITINANATDNIGVVRVELYVDGKYLANDTSAPYSLVWNAKRATLGQHTITMKAFDAAGNSSSNSITITLN